MSDLWKFVLILAIAAPAAFAAERVVALKDAPGKDTVEAMCTGCHSLDYIPLNSPFLDQQGWTAEVNKMINAYGAPIPKADADKAIAYLAANYGKP